LFNLIISNRVESPERKSSQASTSSYSGEERANSMSPEPTEPISVPSFNNSANKQDTESSQKDNTRDVVFSFINQMVGYHTNNYLLYIFFNYLQYLIILKILQIVKTN
jgi:hypothetical protein